MIPLHPDAADALKEVIEIAKAQNAIARRDSSVGRVVNHVFVRRGKLLSATTLFDKPLRDICMKLGLVGPTADRPSARTDSDTPSVPSSLKAVHASKRSWRSSDIMRVILSIGICQEAASSSRASSPSKTFWRPSCPLAAASSRCACRVGRNSMVVWKKVQDSQMDSKWQSRPTGRAQ